MRSLVSWISALENWVVEQPAWIGGPIWIFTWMFIVLAIIIVFALILRFIPWVLAMIPLTWLVLVINYYLKNQG